jgi:hypothetical protein
MSWPLSSDQRAESFWFTETAFPLTILVKRSHNNIILPIRKKAAVLV